MKKVALKIGGMTCSACSSGLERFLNKQIGVESAQVNLVMNNAQVLYDDEKIDVSQIEKYIEKSGFESLGIYNFSKEEKGDTKENHKIIFLIILSAITLYIAMAHMIGLPEPTFLNMHVYPTNYAATLMIITILVLILERNILKNGYKNLIHGTPNMDTLVSIGVLSSFIYSLYGTIMIFTGRTNYVENLYYESAVFVLFFITLGKYIENRNRNKTKEAIQDLMRITPNHATLIKDGIQKEVTLDEIEKGDTVLAKAGDKIAVDGEVIEGISHIDESFVTGESKPVRKETGSKVIAGSINYEGVIKYKAEKIGKESTVSEIVRLVLEATTSKAPIAKTADKTSGYFVPAILIVAFFAFLMWLIIGKNFSFAINVFVTVLVVACPCSLGLATPLAIVMASGSSTKKGILIKASEALENAHKVKTIVFDKTGTLTKGNLIVSKIFNYTDMSNDDILKIVSSVENKSEHPIARAIIGEANNRGIKKIEVSNFKTIAGQGVSGELNEKEYLVGNRKLMQENNVFFDKMEDERYLESEGNSIMLVSENGKIIAAIGVRDELREEAEEVIRRLKERQIKVIMLTGDNLNTAKIVAEKAGIVNVTANVMPKDKAGVIEELKRTGRVMMIGDGINDSVSLVTADVGVSISTGTDIAMNSSDIVLMKDDLNKIIDLIDISKNTIKIIRENLYWAFFYNVCMIPIACGVLVNSGIIMNPMFASIAMVLSSITVTLNSLRCKK